MIIFLCETWLRETDTYIFENLDLSKISYEHKSSIPSDYQHGRPFGGMAWIYTKNMRKRVKINFNHGSMSTLSLDNQIQIIGIYINPSNGQSEYDAALEEITAYLLNRDKSSPICILGDFNGDLIRNNYGNDKALYSWYKNNKEELDMSWATRIYMQKACNTYQLGDRQSLIDHIFLVNKNNWGSLLQANIYLSAEEITNPKINWHSTNASDHRPLEMLLKLDDVSSETETCTAASVTQPTKTIKYKLDWTKPNNIERYRSELEESLNKLDLEKRLEGVTLANAPIKMEDLTKELNSAIYQAYERACRAQHGNNKPRYLEEMEVNRSKSWWNGELDEIHKLKKFYHDKHKKNNSEVDKLLYNHYRNLGRKLQRKQTRESKNRKLTQLSKYHKVNIRKFWAITRKIRNKKTEVKIPIADLEGNYNSAFNTKLNNDGKVDDWSALEMKANDIKKTIGTTIIQREIINRIISELKSNKLGGISGATNEMFKHGADLLTPLITKLFEKYIRFRATPSCLNIGLLFPIIKDENEDHSSIDNTRPITLSDTLAIIYEKYMLLVIERSFEEHELQFGFRKNYSTSHAAFCLRETILMYRAKNKPVYACFLDFSKAFDKINRSILLRKLLEFMDDDHWLSLYQYYSHSTITVMNKDERSNPITTTLGCKQGGPMSPKLFSIYIDAMIWEIANNMNICSIGPTKTGIILYADDTTVLCPTIEDLQTVINYLEKYCSENEITINTKKTKCMVFGSKRQAQTKNIMLNGSLLEFVDKFKFLGMWLKSNLNGDEHIKKRKVMAIAASYRLNTLGLNTNILSAELKSFLVGVYCRSSLQYGIENTYLTGRAYNELESVEARIIKRALGLSKYHSTSMIINALDLTPTVETIKIRKLSYTKQLLRNNLTRRLLGIQLEQRADLATKSYIRELVNLTGANIFSMNLQTIGGICYRKIKEIKSAVERLKGSRDAIAIRYLLTHRNKENDDLLRKLTHWSTKKSVKKAPLRRRATES